MKVPVLYLSYNHEPDKITWQEADAMIIKAEQIYQRLGPDYMDPPKELKDFFERNKTKKDEK